MTCSSLQRLGSGRWMSSSIFKPFLCFVFSVFWNWFMNNQKYILNNFKKVKSTCTCKMSLQNIICLTHKNNFYKNYIIFSHIKTKQNWHFIRYQHNCTSMCNFSLINFYIYVYFLKVHQAKIILIWCNSFLWQFAASLVSKFPGVWFKPKKVRG